jgi:hypothetical protein
VGDFVIKKGGVNERYVRATGGDVLIRPSSGIRTLGGYLVLRPDEAELLVQQLHHWLENERVRNV